MLDYLGILKRLHEQQVRYVVVGGVAVNLHGIPRMTYDLDLLVALDQENLERLLALFDEWEFQPRAPVAMMDLLVVETRLSWIRDKGMKAFTVVNSSWALSEIDVLIDSPVTYEQAALHQENVRLGGIDVPLISIHDLIRMKQHTGRAQDEADLSYLMEIVRKDVDDA